MKHILFLSAALLGLAACSSGDQTAKDIFEVANKSELLSKATSLPCDQDSKTKTSLFREKCWARDISEAEIETVGKESLALGLAIQKAFNSASEIVETDQQGIVLMREKTQDKCAHYVLAHMTEEKVLTEQERVKIKIGVTETPYCGKLDLDSVI